MFVLVIAAFSFSKHLPINMFCNSFLYFTVYFIISVGYSSGVSKAHRDCSCRFKAWKYYDGGPFTAAIESENHRLWLSLCQSRGMDGCDSSDPMVQVGKWLHICVSSTTMSESLSNEWSVDHKQELTSKLVIVITTVTCLCFSCLSKIARGPAGSFL